MIYDDFCYKWILSSLFVGDSLHCWIKIIKTLKAADNSDTTGLQGALKKLDDGINNITHFLPDIHTSEVNTQVYKG